MHVRWLRGRRRSRIEALSIGEKKLRSQGDAARSRCPQVSMTTSTHGRPGIHVLANPVGPICDIKCDYCFYLEKRALVESDERYRMADEVLARYIDGYVAAQLTPVVEFVWHGGEPTLIG